MKRKNTLATAVCAGVLVLAGGFALVLGRGMLGNIFNMMKSQIGAALNPPRQEEVLDPETSKPLNEDDKKDTVGEVDKTAVTLEQRLLAEADARTEPSAVHMTIYGNEIQYTVTGVTVTRDISEYQAQYVNEAGYSLVDAVFSVPSEYGEYGRAPGVDENGLVVDGYEIVIVDVQIENIGEDVEGTFGFNNFHLYLYERKTKEQIFGCEMEYGTYQPGADNMCYITLEGFPAGEVVNTRLFFILPIEHESAEMYFYINPLGTPGLDTYIRITDLV